MKKELLSLITAALLLISMGHNLPGAGRPQELSFSDLTLEISTPKEEFSQLEPIPLTITLSNKTDQPILGHTLVRFTGHRIRLFVNLIGGDERKIETLSMIHAFVSASPEKILPGQVVQEKQLIDLDLDKIFPYAGDYQLRAELLDVDGKKTLKSKHLKIRILEPKGKDLEAFEFIRNKGNPSYFLNGYEVAVNNEAVFVLEDFVAKFSDTGYGDYAILQLGAHYLAKNEFNKAIKLLEKLENKTDFVFANQVRRYISKAKEKLKKSAAPG